MPMPNAKKNKAAQPDEAAPTTQPATDLDPVVVFNLEPNEPFLLRHFPLNWEIGEVVIDGKAGMFLLPDIDRQPILPGIGLIRTTKKDEQPTDAYRREMAERKEEGWVYILNHFAPEKGGGFLRKAACSGQNGTGTFFTDVWTTIKANKNPKQRATLTFDRKAFNLYRYNLVVNGVIEAPDDDEIRTGLIAKRQRHLANRAGDYKVPEQARVKAEKDRAGKLAAAEAAVLPGKQKATAEKSEATNAA